MRIAVIEKDDCKPEVCNHACKRFCPRVRAGDETVVVGEDNKPVIDEDLCIGCGICVKKCPNKCITVVNLPDELEKPIHQYGRNGFRLFGLPVPQAGKVVGLVGLNGVGKTTAVRILAGELKPNLGTDQEFEWADLAKQLGSLELENYFKGMKKRKMVYKTQYVDQIPKAVRGTAGELLKKADKKGELDSVAAELGIDACLDRPIGKVSGGELQRIAIAACLLKKGDLYVFDEPSSYLDVRERLRVASAIRKLAKEAAVLIVEHDLIVLDFLTDYVHVLYGKPRAYGIVSSTYSSRVGINAYLNGFLPDENMRFRNESLTFAKGSAISAGGSKVLTSFSAIKKKFDTFSLTAAAGDLKKEEIVSILGPNATGKTTFVRILAGVMDADSGSVEQNVSVSYKPQYLKPTDALVRAILHETGYSKIKNNFSRFQLDELMNKQLNQLSGGELQRVAITECLSRDADLYLLDEPSAHLDVEQRIAGAKIIRSFIIDSNKAAIVVDHDVLFADYLSDRLMIFSGEPGRSGKASSPAEKRKGMNDFLKSLKITLRRDPENGRPRVNKPGSVKDREQRGAGEYYYI